MFAPKLVEILLFAGLLFLPIGYLLYNPPPESALTRRNFQVIVVANSVSLFVVFALFQPWEVLFDTPSTGETLIYGLAFSLYLFVVILAGIAAVIRFSRRGENS